MLFSTLLDYGIFTLVVGEILLIFHAQKFYINSAENIVSKFLKEIMEV